MHIRETLRTSLALRSTARLIARSGDCHARARERQYRARPLIGKNAAAHPFCAQPGGYRVDAVEESTMELRHLRYFVGPRRRSTSDAPLNHLRVAQPTLSRQIR